MTTVHWAGLTGDLLDDLFEAEDTGPDFGDRYEIRDVLGQGGQGRVYRGWDRALEREVAIKCLVDPGAPQGLLLSEARLLSRLAHPAIPQVYDRGTGPDGGPYVAMQLVGGKRLDKVITRFPVMQRVRIFRTMASAIMHAHSRGILHRDLKPGNVLITDDGEPYIVDWGLAAADGLRGVCGSPNYAAPEQLDGQVADPRADVYSLGVLFYVMLAGQLPYDRKATDFDDFRRNRAAMMPHPLRARDRSLPSALERICDTAMAAQPAARYQTVRELIADIDAFEAGRPLARDLPVVRWRGLGAVSVIAATAVLAFTLGRLTLGGDVPVSNANDAPERGAVRNETPLRDRSAEGAPIGPPPPPERIDWPSVEASGGAVAVVEADPAQDGPGSPADPAKPGDEPGASSEPQVPDDDTPPAALKWSELDALLPPLAPSEGTQALGDAQDGVNAGGPANAAE